MRGPLRASFRVPEPPDSTDQIFRLTAVETLELIGCSDAIAAAVVADIMAREQRAEAEQRLRDEAFPRSDAAPLSTALVEPRR
jgi:hypothetical protein